ncbi:melatonin receptor type 1B-A [Betta splendens]|uniref:Melatonin receptor type 1B-A n=1 Tax=Betta splendens TaxID=158456 RepID=A0A6P7P891_BETSP|nr:melatonin receptor type 1B-A [Betta splendens]
MLQAPGSRFQVPCSRLQAPGSMLQASGFRLHAPGSSLQVPCSRLQAPGSMLHAPCSMLQAGTGWQLNGAAARLFTHVTRLDTAASQRRHTAERHASEPSQRPRGVKESGQMDPSEDESLLKNRTEPGPEPSQEAARPPWVMTALASVLIFTTVVDVLGNLLVIVAVLRNRKLRNAGNVFVLSLAFADLLVAFYPYPLVLYAIFHDGWSLGETQCKVSGFLMGLSVIGSIFNITGIAINRYCYICHSFSYDKLYSYRNTLLLVALIWLLTVVAIVPNFFVGSLQYDPRIYSCTFAQTVSTSYTITVVIIHFFVPIAVVTFCYLRIWILVIQVRRKVKSDICPRIKPSDLRNFITMFVVFVLFAICWAPLNFIGLAVALNPKEVVTRIPEWLFVVSYFMAYFNSCLNAIIYGLLNQNFRREYKRIVMSVWMPHLFFQETSRGGTEAMKSKPSPGLNNNEQVKGESL